MRNVDHISLAEEDLAAELLDGERKDPGPSVEGSLDMSCPASVELNGCKNNQRATEAPSNNCLISLFIVSLISI
jgi:hypothetical protein